MPNRRDDLDSALVENAPVAIWHEDFFDVKRYLDELQASGIEDISAHLIAHPGAVRECVRRIRVLQVNRLARDFYGAEHRDELVGRLPELFDTAALDVFRRELVELRKARLRSKQNLWRARFEGTNAVQMNVSVTPRAKRPWSESSSPSPISQNENASKMNFCRHRSSKVSAGLPVVSRTTSKRAYRHQRLQRYPAGRGFA